MVWLIKVCLMLLLAAGSLFALTGCATPPAGENISERVSDRELERLVMSRIAQEVLLDRATIMAVSDESVVTLKGMIITESQRMRAIAIARATPGVLGVIDQLTRR